MMTSYLFRNNLVHHAPVPRKLSDRAALVWGVIWTLISTSVIAVCWTVGRTPWDPLWTGLVVIGIALAATLSGTVSRLDATLVFTISPATLVILYMSTDFGTAIAVWGTANLVTLLIRMRNVWDAAEQLSYVLGSAMIALWVVGSLRSAYGWHEIYTVLALLAYFATRFTISTIRMSVVTPISVSDSIAAIIPMRAAMVFVGIPSLALAGRFLQVYIAEHSPLFGPYWSGGIAVLSMGIFSFVLAMTWTIRVIDTQLKGIHDAAIGLPWPEDRPVAESAQEFVKRALPAYEIEFRSEAGRNINEISSPMADGHLIARRGNNQAPLLEADQLILDSIAHIGDTMADVRSDHDRLFRQALTDTITKLPNYRAFTEVLEETARGASSGMAVVYIDIDGFKTINDRFGHENGNKILHTLGARLRDFLTDDEFVARVGGDEFVLILYGLDDEEAGHERVRELVDAVCGPVMIGTARIPIVLSYGLSYAGPGSVDTSRLVEQADAEMYEGRRARRGTDGRRSESLATGVVARGIRESDLTFAYQPIVDDETGRIVSVEALVRPGKTSLAGENAEQIIGRARCEGSLTELSSYLMRIAAAGMARFRSAVPERTGLHVNIDVEQVIDDEFMASLRREWAGTGTVLTLELGEASLGRRLDNVTKRLEAMVETPGLHIALDDFGSQACTLESVIHFPFDVLKVDKSVVAARSRKSDIIVSGIVALGRGLGTKVVFEGVEDDETHEWLRSHGARYMQGYRFAQPLYADELYDRLSRHGLAATVS